MIITNISNNELSLKNITILSAEKFEDYLFIVLDNNQKIIVRGKEIYDVSNYRSLYEIVNVGGSLCAVLGKENSKCIVDLKTMEVLYENPEMCYVTKAGDNESVLIIVTYSNSVIIFDVKKRKELFEPDGYEYSKSENNLYIFSEKGKRFSDIYSIKRKVLNIDGEVIYDNIDGFVEIYDGYLLVKREDEFCIIQDRKETPKKQKNDDIASPEFYNGNIYFYKKGKINICTPDLKLVDQITIDGLEEICYHEIENGILKLCLPYSKNGKTINKHLVINLNNKEVITDIRINGYPGFEPLVYVAQSGINDKQLDGFQPNQEYEQTNYRFYNLDFEKTAEIVGNYCLSVDNSIFVVGIWDGKTIKRKYINAITGVIKEHDYEKIVFKPHNPYGYAFNNITGMADIIDRDICVIVPNIDYKKHHFFTNMCFSDELSYFVVNDYVCIRQHIYDGPKNYIKTIIQNKNGDVVLDSLDCYCSPIGNFIQINRDGVSSFLNTLNGEIAPLSIKVPVNENGKLDSNTLDNLGNIFYVEEASQPLLEQCANDSQKKTKHTQPCNQHDTNNQ